MNSKQNNVKPNEILKILQEKIRIEFECISMDYNTMARESSWIGICWDTKNWFKLELSYLKVKL